jgi:hypothetical protein
LKILFCGTRGERIVLGVITNGKVALDFAHRMFGDQQIPPQQRVKDMTDRRSMHQLQDKQVGLPRKKKKFS